MKTKRNKVKFQKRIIRFFIFWFSVDGILNVDDIKKVNGQSSVRNKIFIVKITTFNALTNCKVSSSYHFISKSSNGSSLSMASTCLNLAFLNKQLYSSFLDVQKQKKDDTP